MIGWYECPMCGQQDLRIKGRFRYNYAKCSNCGMESGKLPKEEDVEVAFRNAYYIIKNKEQNNEIIRLRGKVYDNDTCIAQLERDLKSRGTDGCCDISGWYAEDDDGWTLVTTQSTTVIQLVETHRVLTGNKKATLDLRYIAKGQRFPDTTGNAGLKALFGNGSD